VGKVISIISSEYDSIEKGFPSLPFALAAIFLNCFFYILLGVSVGWKYSLGCFIFWILLFVVAHTAGTVIKNLKHKMSISNDKRLSLINDMIIGIRTIKCYAWENHYLKKLN
jgi:ABC-type multidrug transport system fused ATPase/permease subunit